MHAAFSSGVLMHLFVHFTHVIVLGCTSIFLGYGWLDSQHSICSGSKCCKHSCCTGVQAEKHVSDMVVAAALYAKIDRPAGVVRFAKRQDPDDLLNKWSNNLAKLLEVVERSCQQIQKESMVHKVPVGAS